jgi:hypothetical protein
MGDITAKEETVESKRAREQRALRKLREKRGQQLLHAQEAADSLREELRITRAVTKQCDALSNHSKGFYEEINKLTKGKHLIPVTDLAVQQANDIIRDAKKVVSKDVHLDRVKEFVPAGDNPVYPDVLVTIRAVRDSLDRCSKELGNKAEALKLRIGKAQTVIGALAYFLDDANEGGEDEDKNYPSKDAIQPYVEGSVSDSCFSQFVDTFEKHFDFDRLDREGLQEYLSPPENTEERADESHELEDGKEAERDEGEDGQHEKGNGDEGE